MKIIIKIKHMIWAKTPDKIEKKWKNDTSCAMLGSHENVSAEFVVIVNDVRCQITDLPIWVQISWSETWIADWIISCWWYIVASPEKIQHNALIEVLYRICWNYNAREDWNERTIGNMHTKQYRRWETRATKLCWSTNQVFHSIIIIVGDSNVPDRSISWALYSFAVERHCK